MTYHFQFDQVFAAWPHLLHGTWITIQLSLTATGLGLLVAILCAWGKTSGPGWLRYVSNAYIELIRNTREFIEGNAQPRLAMERFVLELNGILPLGLSAEAA